VNDLNLRLKIDERKVGLGSWLPHGSWPLKAKRILMFDASEVSVVEA